MSYATFSRSYLQGLPEMIKQGELDRHLDNVVRVIQSAALEGKTSYLYNPDGGPSGPGIRFNGRFTYTDDDFILAFKRRFPDCDVIYQEKWDDVSPENKILLKGILIDWS